MKLQSLGAGVVLGLVGAIVAAAQGKPATVLDGVFTSQQVQRGAQQYEAVCAACHEGDEPEANPPKGAGFIDRWREAPVGFLYNFLRANMPGDKPGSLSEANYVDLVAYLLQNEDYPAGAVELTAAKTAGILFVGHDGPKPLPDNALVSAAGCLASNAQGDWMLSAATAPARTRSGDTTSPEEIAASAAAPLGQASYRLNNAEDLAVAKLKGRKVQAKGVLTKVLNPYTLSVQSLEAAGDGCGK
jgi:mono/diheme cytochrome c family protein